MCSQKTSLLSARAWYSGQSSWLQIQRSGFDSRHCQIFWEVVALERGPLSLVSTTEELLERKSSSFSLESREYGRRNRLRWPRSTLYPQNSALISQTSGGLSVATVRSRTWATEFNLVYFISFLGNCYCRGFFRFVLCTMYVLGFYGTAVMDVFVLLNPIHMN
jgi:hypothetical protein